MRSLVSLSCILCCISKLSCREENKDCAVSKRAIKSSRIEFHILICSWHSRWKGHSNLVNLLPFFPCVFQKVDHSQWRRFLSSFLQQMPPVKQLVLKKTTAKSDVRYKQRSWHWSCDRWSLTLVYHSCRRQCHWAKKNCQADRYAPFEHSCFQLLCRPNVQHFIIILRYSTSQLNGPITLNAHKGQGTLYQNKCWVYRVNWVGCTAHPFLPQTY